MTRITVFTSIEITSRISTSKIFVFTFYLNEHIKTQKITFAQMKVMKYLCIDALIRKKHIGIICKEI